jgi:hypothetical protein
MFGDQSIIALIFIGGLVVLVGFLVISYLNQTVFFKKGPASLSSAATYEFRNKVKQPFLEQDV